MEEKKLSDEANRFLLDLRCCIYHNCAFCSQWNNGFEEDDCREEMLNRAKNFIHRLQEKNAKQKVEIERKNFALLEAKTNMTAYGTACVKSGYEKAVKDTAKEIWEDCIDEIMRGCGDDKEFWIVKILVETFKKYGVGFEEVE